MKTIVFLNIKGGVAKTTSALAFAQILTDDYHKRVLLVDADQQGNATHSLLPDGGKCFFGTADMLTVPNTIPPESLIHQTSCGFDLIAASFRLMEANKTCMLDATRPQQFRFKRQLLQPAIADHYDFLIFDCPPDISMAAINALAIADDVLVPVRADKFGFDGLLYVVNTIETLRESNERLRLVGSFLTMTRARTNLAIYSEELLKTTGVPAFKTAIRACTRVGESTFTTPLLRYAPNCTAAEDYRALVAEYLNGGEEACH